MGEEFERHREIVKMNKFHEKVKAFECVITKSATLTVIAKDEQDAYEEACAVLDGEKGWSEYSNDGWEVVPELIEEQNNETR